MYKGFVFFGLSLFCVDLNAQSDLDYYKVHELKINDLNVLTSGADVDFGYNSNVDQAKNIELGYYIWIEDSWYKITNSNKIFNSEKNAPAYFTLTNSNKTDLTIKDQSGVVYSYPLAAIENYKVSNLIYKTNLDVFENVAEANEQKISVVDESSIMNSDEDSLSEKVTDAINNVSENESTLIEEDSDVAQVIEEPNLVDDFSSEEVHENIENSDNENIQTEINQNAALFEEAEDGSILVPVSQDVVISQDFIDKEKSDAILSVNETNVVDLQNEPPKNAYEKALLEGFDGTVTEWVESINALGGETAYQQAVNDGFKGTEDEWLRSLWGSNLDPVIEKQDKISGIVSQWISELNSSPGNSPYDLAIKNGFYGSYTEWIESVIGKDGETEYNLAVEGGFEGSYKEWIESKLKASNEEMLRKEKLKKNNFVIVPNLELQLSENPDEILEFDLYDYYQLYFGNSMLSSSNSNVNKVSLLPTDLEYQITWFKKDQIEILELNNLGKLKYKTLIQNEGNKTFINIRFLMP